MRLPIAAWFLVALVALPASSQTVALPRPDLAALEPSVGAQLAQLREFAGTVVHNSLSTITDKVNAWGDLGKVYHAYDLLSAAEACYTQAEALDPTAFDWPYYRGHVALAKGDLQGAVDRFSRALELEPESLALLVHLADAERDLGRSGAAQALLERAAALRRGDPVVEARLGELALSEGQYEEAVELLSGVLEIIPRANRLHHPLGMAYRQLGDMERARHHLSLRGDIGLAPTDPLMEELETLQVGERVHLLRGRAAFQAGSMQEAAREFQMAVEADPGSVRARINLSAALAGMNDAAGALRELEEVVSLAPENPTARFNLATLLASAGEHRLALDQFAVVTAMRPLDEEAWLGEARSWLALGDFARATARLSAAASASPESGRLAYALARLLAAAPDRAVRDGERALDLALRVFAAQRSSAHAVLVSLALRELGRCDEAAGWLEDLIAKGEAEGSMVEVDVLRAERAGFPATAPCRP